MSSQASRAGRLLAGLLTITSLGAGVAVRPAMGQEEPAGKAQGGDTDNTLPPVRVSAPSLKTTTLPPDSTTTVIDDKVIERKQSSTIFDVVKDAPGVSVDGGPRATGMKFNVRGFRGNEDVLFKIDDAVKGFEKYRFGSGVFIEPELIKSVTVERGPSLLTGAGAIGGAVIATTKDAFDLLESGQRIGGLLKTSYNDNNHGWMRMATAFARPTANSGLVVSLIRRTSDDFRLGNDDITHGERFPASAENSESSFIKYTHYLTDDLKLELSRTAFKSGPTYTPFDANSSNAFVGGYVHQTVDDETLNARVNYDPGSPLIKLKAALAHETTKLDNLMRTGAGESTFTVPCTTSPCQWNALGGPTGEITDRWNYDIWTAEVFNDSRYTAGPVAGTLTAGLQWVRNARDLKRVTENPLMNQPDGKYPGGYDSQQPSGVRASTGVVLQNVLELDGWRLTTGLRNDSYSIKTKGQAKTDLNQAGEDAQYSFSRTSRSAGISWQPGKGPWTLTYRWTEGFRPPLITDYFGMGAASPCAGFYWQGQALAPNGCGNLLDTTTSINRDYTLAWNPSPSGTRHTQARLTYFHITTDSLSGASYLRVANGGIVQPFSERRNGVEFEVQHDTPTWYAMLNFSRIWATRENKLDGSKAEFTAGIPGPTLGLTAGYRLFEGRLEVGWRLRQIWDQLVIANGQALTESTQYCGRVTSEGVVHAASTMQDIFAIWQVRKGITVQVGVNNLYDKHWCNNGDELGNIIGLMGPGRSIRSTLTMKF
jgi:hemoglobin/transferrin/lactoferrin receptor protein